MVCEDTNHLHYFSIFQQISYLCTAMNYLTVSNLSKSFGDKLLFENITFFIDKGQKVALIAQNGHGKSTLIKIIQGLEPADSGEVKIHKDIHVGILVQDPVFDKESTVYEAILSSDNPLLKVCLEYEEALAGHGDLNKAMLEMDRLHAWDYENQIKQILTRFLITDLTQKVGTLSGGQTKRLALAILLIRQPELLILDEPTNHLDLDMIEWLEDYLSKENITLLMVTHDRYFLENICTDILELEDKVLYKHKGNYSKYLENKEMREEHQRVGILKARNIFRKELEWMRRQPKARTTKAKSREDNFENVQQAASKKIEQDKLELEIRMSRMGGKILELHNITKKFGDKVLFDKFTYKFQRGERIGIVGRNGSGKSTLLNIITGRDKSDSGNIVLGETVVFGYYDQKGLQLKEDKRVIDVVRDIAEYIPVVGGQLSASKMLERFLFSPSQQYNYVSTLSGGERRRLYLLTVLMKNPNFLILDEPTNDLDIMSLNVLEDFLMEYKGCLIIVSHDRYFLDKLTQWLFVFEENAHIRAFLGNYREYREAIKQEQKAEPLKKEKQEVVQPVVSVAKEKRKLTYNEQREFNQLESEIEKLNAEKEILLGKLSSGIEDHVLLAEISQKLESVVDAIDYKEMRWLELSEFA